MHHTFTPNQYLVDVFAIWNIGKRGPGKIRIYTSQLSGLSHYRYINCPSSAKTHWLFEQLVQVYIIGKHHRASHICRLKVYVIFAPNNDVLPIRWQTIAKSVFYYWQMVPHEQNSIKLRWFLIKKIRNLSSVIYWPFHSGLNVLTHLPLDKMADIFTDDIVKRIFLNENITISIQFSLKFVPKGPIDNISALV